MDDYGRRLTLLVAQAMERRRVEQGLSLDEVAARAQMHRTSVGLIVRGKRGITLDTGARVSEALGLSLSELVSQAEEQLKET